MNEDMHIVLGSNSSHKVQAFGPFKSEAAAERWAKRMGRLVPRVDWLVLPVCHRSAAEPMVFS